MRQIPGMLMRPCSTSLKGNERVMMSSDYSVKKNFYKAYREHIIQMQIVAECAKVYIQKNWTKVQSWKELDVIIVDNTRTKTEYYNYKNNKRKSKSRSATMQRLLKDLDEGNKEKNNPIKTVSEVVLDPSDGDFSLTINGKQHMWIDNDSVIIIARYVEETLKKQRALKRLKTKK